MTNLNITRGGAAATAVLPAALLALLGAVLYGMNIRWALTATLCFAGAGVAALLVRRRTYTVLLTPLGLYVRRGFLYITRRQVRFSAILGLEIWQTPMHSLFRSCCLRVNTVGGSFWICGLALADALTLRTAAADGRWDENDGDTGADVVPGEEGRPGEGLL